MPKHFYCNECDTFYSEEELYFDSAAEAFRCNKCGNLVEYIFNKGGG